MAHITGLTVYGRELAPGDEIMNEWSGEILTVERMSVTEQGEVKLWCRRANGRMEILDGDWNCRTRLVTRKVPDYAPDPEPEDSGLTG